jgi:hypothetical protein
MALLKREEEVEVDVTAEDQQNINSFGKLFRKWSDLNEGMKTYEELCANLEDASTDIMLLGDDEPVKFLFGEVCLLPCRRRMRAICLCDHHKSRVMDQKVH